MPIYEFECPEGHLVDEYVPARDIGKPESRTVPCPRCSAEGKVNLAERVLSATPTTFKHNDTKAIKGRT